MNQNKQVPTNEVKPKTPPLGVPTTPSKDEPKKQGASQPEKPTNPSRPQDPDSPNKLYEEQLPPENDLT